MMKRTLAALMLTLGLFELPARAQNGQINFNLFDKSFDSTFVADYSDLFVLRFYGISKSNHLSLRNGSHDLVYRPNDNFNIGLGFNYRFIGINLAFNFPFINRDEQTFGETRLFDMQVNVYDRKFGVDAFIQSYRGYYVDNPQDYQDIWNTRGIVPIRSDIRLTGFGANAYYVFNHRRFSFRAPFIQNERQKKSAGSWIAGAHLGFTHVNSDSTGLITGQLQHYFDSAAAIRKAGYFNLGLFGGYAHTFIFEKYFFLTLSLNLGLSLQISSIRTPYPQFNNEDGRPLGLKTLFRAAMGYNSDAYFFGLNTVIDGQTLGQSLRYNLMILRVVYVKRLDFKPERLIKQLW